jgi:hypothetical protein
MEKWRKQAYKNNWKKLQVWLIKREKKKYYLNLAKHYVSIELFGDF